MNRVIAISVRVESNPVHKLSWQSDFHACEVEGGCERLPVIADAANIIPVISLTRAERGRFGSPWNCDTLSQASDLGDG
jgi:hypothetical protein